MTIAPHQVHNADEKLMVAANKFVRIRDGYGDHAAIIIPSASCSGQLESVFRLRQRQI